MRKGFIFDHNKCVSCKACSAACMIENGWNVSSRQIFTYNSESESLLPVINLSLACNHCESAICMEGCPTAAMSRDNDTGAILLDQLKCIGCRYCQWNCPYDAPKFDDRNKTIQKCNLCNSALNAGGQPACSSGCPTGALSFGNIPPTEVGKFLSWFPEKKLNPSIQFISEIGDIPLEIIPGHLFQPQKIKASLQAKKISSEISLILFTFLSTLAVSSSVTSFIKGIFPSGKIIIPLIVLAGLISVLHLGRKIRSWRALTNLKRSPLSREIAMFIIYTAFSFFTLLFNLPLLLIITSVAGFIFLITIDSVYIYSDRRKSLFFHSGQAFISSLLIISFFSGISSAFIFIALIKLISSVYFQWKEHNNRTSGLRFFRMSFLIIAGGSMISNISYHEIAVAAIFLTGELFDRILFYIDFNPLNINTMIQEQLNFDRNEKQRS